MPKLAQGFLIFILVASIVLLAVGYFNTSNQIRLLSQKIPTSTQNTIPTEVENDEEGVSDICGKTCLNKIEVEVAKAIATISATTKTVVQKTVTNPSTQTTYIPLSGPITSTSTSWVDAAGTDVYIDVKSDYGDSAKVSWDAFLKVAHGNGTAFARLFDITHGIAVVGSELSISNPDSTQISSGNLNLWAGRNLYRVQLKSLNSFEVTFGSGRIKVTY